MIFASLHRWLHRLVNRKPRILLFLDYKGWAYDNSAQEIASRLSDRYDFDFYYVNEQKKLPRKRGKYDLVYVFFWGEKRHLRYAFPKLKIIKEVSSHRWIDDERFGPCSTEAMVDKYLCDAATIICTSERLFGELQPFCPRLFFTPNGINPDKFFKSANRSSHLTIGWAGNINDPVKGYNELIAPLSGERFRIITAPGNVSRADMNNFYNRIDVLVISSKHEGEPLTLLEAMACGCFPVCVDVGIVPELVEHKRNGYIVQERTTAAFQEAFLWCDNHLQYVRDAGARNEKLVTEKRGWDHCVKAFDQVFKSTLTNCRR